MTRITYSILIVLILPTYIHAAITYLNSNTDYSQLIEKNAPLVIEFAAPWCGACHTIKKMYEDIAKDPEFNHITFACLDTEIAQLAPICQNYNIEGIPTFVFIENNEIKNKQIGISNPRAFNEQFRTTLRSTFNKK